MESRRTVAYLGLGSNMGDRLGHLESGVAALNGLPASRVLRQSPIYVSDAWGKTDQDGFLNMVVEMQTGLEAGTLLVYCKEVERAEGRVVGERWGPRPLDVDILLFGDTALSTPELTVPHARMWDRRFVLQPLYDLRPDLVVPHGVSLGSLLESEAIASQRVWPYEPGKSSDEP